MEINKELYKKQGIYKLKICNNNDYVYIGESLNLEQRLNQHYYNFKNMIYKDSYSKKFGECFNYYIEKLNQNKDLEPFSFEILEFVDQPNNEKYKRYVLKTALLYLEKKYMNSEKKIRIKNRNHKIVNTQNSFDICKIGNKKIDENCENLEISMLLCFEIERIKDIQKFYNKCTDEYIDNIISIEDDSKYYSPYCKYLYKLDLKKEYLPTDIYPNPILYNKYPIKNFLGKCCKFTILKNNKFIIHEFYNEKIYIEEVDRIVNELYNGIISNNTLKVKANNIFAWNFLSCSSNKDVENLSFGLHYEYDNNDGGYFSFKKDSEITTNKNIKDNLYNYIKNGLYY